MSRAALAVPLAAMARHKEFDADHALAAAMTVFWSKGYEGASLRDLTSAMGISRTSLYATFGNKETLFFKALARYDGLRLAFIGEALERPTAREAIRSLLEGAARAQTDASWPTGCMAITSALVVSDAGRTVKDELTRLRGLIEARLRQRLARAQADGDLPGGDDPADLARYVMTTVYGMAVQAASGASRSDLLRIVELALRGARLA